MRTKITVTKEDIEKGQRRSNLYCPIALACSRHFPFMISVCSDTIYVDERDRVKLPARARKFILAFDNCFDDRVKPFSFFIEAP